MTTERNSAIVEVLDWLYAQRYLAGSLTPAMLLPLIPDRLAAPAPVREEDDMERARR